MMKSHAHSEVRGPMTKYETEGNLKPAEAYQEMVGDAQKLGPLAQATHSFKVTHLPPERNEGNFVAGRGYPTPVELAPVYYHRYGDKLHAATNKAFLEINHTLERDEEGKVKEDSAPVESYTNTLQMLCFQCCATSTN